ncbi:MAG: hypothetical protein Kow0099_20410 [Candidatus Abyssubacteria bacterium]
MKEEGKDKDTHLRILVRKNDSRHEWASQTAGNYLLRTNWPEKDPHKLWKTYIQLTQVEDAFRITKSDLRICRIRQVFSSIADFR